MYDSSINSFLMKLNQRKFTKIELSMASGKVKSYNLHPTEPFSLVSSDPSSGVKGVDVCFIHPKTNKSSKVQVLFDNIFTEEDDSRTIHLVMTLPESEGTIGGFVILNLIS